MSTKATKFNTVAILGLPNQAIPQEAFEKVMDEHKSVAGFTAALADEDPPVLEVWSDTNFPSIKEVMDQDEKYKDVTRIFTFSDFPAEFSDESKQPFIVLEFKDGEEEPVPLLTAVIDGTFPNFEEDGEDGAQAVATVLKGSFELAFSKVANVEELCEAIQTDPAISKMIKGLSGKNRQHITILSENGEVWTYGENPDLAKFDWGWMTKSCGYGVKSAGEKLTDAIGTAAKTVRSFSRGRRGGAAEPSPGKTDTAAGSLPAAEQAGAASSDAGGDPDTMGDNSLYVMWAPSPDLAKDPRRDAYKFVNAGIVPTNYKKNPPPEVKVLRTKVAEYNKKFGIKQIADVEPIKQPDVSSKTEIIPKAPPAEITAHKQKFMKRAVPVRITNEGRGIIDPKRIDETEQEFAMYHEIAGLSSVHDLHAYEFADWLDLAQNYPHLAAIALMNLDGEVIKRTPEEELNPAVDEPEVPEVEAKATGTQGRGSRSMAPTKAQTAKPAGRSFSRR